MMDWRSRVGGGRGGSKNEREMAEKIEGRVGFGGGRLPRGCGELSKQINKCIWFHNCFWRTSSMRLSIYRASCWSRDRKSNTISLASLFDRLST